MKYSHRFTCLPRARRIPPVTAAVPSKTWKSATRGRIAAVKTTTSANENSACYIWWCMKIVNCTGIVIEQVCPCVLENQEHRTVAENSVNVVTEPLKSLESAYLHTALIRKTMRMATLPDTSALSAFSSPSRFPILVADFELFLDRVDNTCGLRTARKWQCSKRTQLGKSLRLRRVEQIV